MNETARRFQERAARFGAIVDGAAARWDSPTPCAGWTVRDVVGHAIETERDFLARHGFDVGAAPDLGEPAAAWARHADTATAVLEGPGVADTEFDGYFGPTTIAATMADFYGWDLVVHGWDVASATDQSWHLDDDEAEAMMRTADGWGAALYAEGVCGPAVAVGDDAAAAARLLGRLGRDPGWRPPRA